MSNDCYVRSLLYCLNRCTPCIELDRYIPPHTYGLMGDPHDLYMKFIDTISPIVSNRYMIQYDNGIKIPYLSMCNDMVLEGSNIISVSDIICIYRIPIPISYNDLYYIEIDIGGKTYEYKMCCCICYQHGGNGNEVLRWHGYVPNIDGIDHYYPIDMNDIYDLSMKVPMYMIFYRKV